MSVSFALSSAQEEFRRVVRDFANRVIDPVADELNATGRFPLHIVEHMGALGLFGIPFDQSYGGMGGDFLTLCLAIEEVGRVDQSLGITLEAGVGLGAVPIHDFGTEEQNQRWLPELCRGQKLAAFGLTEAGGGSDNWGSTRTRAVWDGDDWVINSSKVFITNAGTELTSVVTITAWTGDQEMSAIIVPVDTPGFEAAAPCLPVRHTRFCIPLRIYGCVQQFPIERGSEDGRTGWGPGATADLRTLAGLKAVVAGDTSGRHAQRRPA